MKLDISYENAARNWALGFTMVFYQVATTLFLATYVFPTFENWLFRLAAFITGCAMILYIWGYYNPIHFYEFWETTERVEKVHKELRKE